MLILRYIHHDAFLLQSTDGFAIAFDYWLDPAGILPALPADTRLYFVVSHHHKDHFDPRIFDLLRAYPQARYILSKDTARHVRHRLDPASHYQGEKIPPERVTVLRPGESSDLHDFRIQAFASTDIGNSYVVTLPGQSPYNSPMWARQADSTISILHAGDLNAWLWLDESTPGEVKDMLNRYQKILADIARAYPALDVAMFPVDSRIGREYWTGARLLLEQIAVGTLLPMHFGLGDTPAAQARYRADALDLRQMGFAAWPRKAPTRYVALTAPGDLLTI